MTKKTNIKLPKLSPTGKLYFAIMQWDLEDFVKSGRQIPAHCL